MTTPLENLLAEWDMVEIDIADSNKMYDDFEKFVNRELPVSNKTPLESLLEEWDD